MSAYNESEIGILEERAMSNTKEGELIGSGQRSSSVVSLSAVEVDEAIDEELVRKIGLEVLKREDGSIKLLPRLTRAGKLHDFYVLLGYAQKYLEIPPQNLSFL